MRKIIIGAIFIACVAILSTVVNAANLGVALSTGNTTPKPGDTVTVNVNVSGLSGVTNGINVLMFTLQYDKNVFETVAATDMAPQGGWSAPSYNPATGQLETDNASFMTTDGNVMTITLKVKAGIADTAGDISITGISASNGDGDIAASDNSLTITVKNAASSTNTNNTNTNTNTQNPPTDNDTNANVITGTNNNNTNNANTNTNNKTSNTAKNNVTALPYTGIGSIIYILIAVIGVAGFITYIRYKGLKIE